MIKFSTTRFGEVEIAENQIIHFPDGVIGFEDCTRYTLLEKDGNATVWWLQSLDRPEVAFILTNPFFFMLDYHPKITPVERAILQVKEISETEVSAILVVQRETRAITANLLAPVLINHAQKIGKQVVLRNSGYSTVHPIMQSCLTSKKEGV